MTAGRTVLVLGAGAGNLKSTVAANLVCALAAAGVDVALADADGASSRALRVGAPYGRALAPLPWVGRVLRLDDAPDPRPLTGEVLVVDPPPRFDDAARGRIRDADLVLVPVDASSLAFRVLGEVAGHVGALPDDRRPLLRVALGRLLPRDVDRWGLVDRIDEAAPGALVHTTLPMARTVRVGADRQARLYAPGTAAARAYARLARELLDALAPFDRRPGEKPGPSDVASDAGSPRSRG